MAEPATVGNRTERPERRLAALEQGAGADGFDALIISRWSDVYYLTGFNPGQADDVVAVLILTPDGEHDEFVTDRRYEHEIGVKLPHFHCAIIGAPSTGASDSDGGERYPHDYYSAVGYLLSRAGYRRVGYYGRDLSHESFLHMQRSAGSVRFEQAPAYVEHMRAIKDAGEIALIRRACAISVKSFYALLDSIKPGVSERDIANELEWQFRAHGGDGSCFASIVASGPQNGADCHATVTDRSLQTGDFVTIDFGTAYHGYCSDITRTVSVGEPRSPEMRTVYQLVRNAQRAMVDRLADGATLREVNRAAFGTVERGGHRIPHGVGHSFGLECHELPYISAADQHLAPGMVTTCEPGVYVPGLCGVRIEDDYLRTAGGLEHLTPITSELIAL